MRRFACVAVMLALCSSPGLAQHHEHMDHGSSPPPSQEGDHSAHQAPAPVVNNAHANHASPADSADVPVGVAPAVPADHAADAYYDRASMARARAVMVRENGGMRFSQIMLDRLEYRAGKGGDGYHWEGEAWAGGDIHRFTVKTEGEGDFGGRLDNAEVQALYSRAIDPWFNLETGVRHDIRSGPDRSYAVVGIDGLAPYWFEVSAQGFLSTKGDAHLRLEASYDQRVTQRLILQPAAEVNIAMQDVPELGVGSGISDIELGLRLRYEFVREFAPFLGVNWERKLGRTADFAKAEGEGASATQFVMGVRFWF